MKLIAVGLALVLVLVFVGLALLSHRSRHVAQCSGRIVIVPSRGGPLECVCEDGVLATCFKPGP